MQIEEENVGQATRPALLCVAFCVTVKAALHALKSLLSYPPVTLVHKRHTHTCQNTSPLLSYVPDTTVNLTQRATRGVGVGRWTPYAGKKVCQNYKEREDGIMTSLYTTNIIKLAKKWVSAIFDFYSSRNSPCCQTNVRFILILILIFLLPHTYLQQELTVIVESILILLPLPLPI